MAAPGLQYQLRSAFDSPKPRTICECRKHPPDDDHPDVPVFLAEAADIVEQRRATPAAPI